jgi:hypothetical protein
MNRVPALVLLIAAPLIACAADKPDPRLQPGTLVSPNGACQVEVAISGMGGATELTPKGRKNPVARDITGALWRGPTKLVYSVSPIYGRPGLFEFDCKAGAVKTLVEPANKSRAYPDGADYFELVRVDSGRNEACYYYAADVDSADFETFRAPNNLRCTKLK